MLAVITGLVILILATPAAAAAQGGQDATRDAAWRSPLAKDIQVLRRFEAPATPWGAGHRGVDLAARPGQAVYAAGPGRIGYAGAVAGRGVVTVVHGSLRTTYLPVTASVRAGARVATGDDLGAVADRAGHCAPDHCLHWGLIRGSEYLDPLALLGIGPVRLLPFWGEPTPAAEAPQGQGGFSTSGPHGPQGVERPSDDTTEPRSTPRAAARSPAGAPSVESAGEPTDEPADEPGARNGGVSLAAVTGYATGSAGAAGLILAFAVLARSRTRRTAPLPTGVVGLDRERRRRRHRPRCRGDPR